MSPLDLLASLHRVNWRVATRTFGSSHATLIGLVSGWWIALDPESHTVLDGAPSFGTGNAGWCDLMLCTSDGPRGVVEVEGTKPLDKLKTLEGYFNSSKPDLEPLSFGLLVMYAYFIKGRGTSRAYPPAESAEVYTEALQLSSRQPAKAIILLAIDKTIDPKPGRTRAASPYHLGSVSMVTGIALGGGKELARHPLWPAQHLTPSGEVLYLPKEGP